MTWKRALLWLVKGVAVVALGAALAVTALWGLAASRLRDESTVVATVDGPIEVASLGRPGDPPILFLHGSPGGYDQLLPLARTVAAGGYRAIAVSRPGYLRTPQHLGVTPQAQADALAGLLDALGVDPVVVVGISGGGPSTLQLALRHPARVRALILICPVTKRLREGEPDPADVRAFDWAWDLGALAGRWSPDVGLRMLGVDDATQRRRLLRDVATRESVAYLFQSFGFSGRRRGYEADTLSYAWDDLDDPPLATLEVPILLLHGSEDANVPLAHSLKVADQAPRADLRVLDGAGHAFFVLRRDWLDAQIFDFLLTLETEPSAR